MASLSDASLVAGIDIGATNLRCALARKDTPGRLIAQRHMKTPTGTGTEPVLDAIETAFEHLLHDVEANWQAIASFGSTAPGITDARHGIVIDAVNMPGWIDIPWKASLEARFDRPSVVENDVNAAALGEYTYGAGQDADVLVYLTISTGVAAGIVIEGTLLRGHHHAAGELGYFVPDRTHLGKDWEGIGCLELTSAGVGLSRQWAAEQGGPGSTDRAREVFSAAEEGHPAAKALVTRAADYLAMAAVALATVIDPEVIVLGGSIAKHQERISGRIREVVATTVPFPPRIVPAGLAGDAPLVGALTLAARRVL